MNEPIAYSESVLSDIGLLAYSEILMKPSLGKYRALKLYDAQRNVEGEIWVKLVIRIFQRDPGGVEFPPGDKGRCRPRYNRRKGVGKVR